MQIGQVTTSAINITPQNLALTGVDHLRRPKNAMDGLGRMWLFYVE